MQDITTICEAKNGGSSEAIKGVDRLCLCGGSRK